jgi:hypothetical protein
MGKVGIVNFRYRSELALNYILSEVEGAVKGVTNPGSTETQNMEVRDESAP